MVETLARSGPTETPHLVAGDDSNVFTLQLFGDWVVAEAAALEALRISPVRAGIREVSIRAGGLRSLDSAGALVLAEFQRNLETGGSRVTFVDLAEAHNMLLDLVRQKYVSPAAETPPPSLAVAIRATMDMLGDRSVGFLTFVGRVFLVSMRQLARPRTIRWGLVVRNLQTAGVDALPIVGLLSFLIGIVIAYQGAVQLHKYGADIFIVDLVGLSILRELAPLMTAILVAGRTGSAFTAQIGTMKVTEEVDALQVLAMNPIEVLVIPKVFALLIALPLLTAFAGFVAILGGILMTASMTPIGPTLFLEQFPRVVLPQSYLVGIGKAPVFAVVIATVGCYQGFRTTGSAESVGTQTTVSVVQSIFLLIVLDALFSIIFSMVGI